jgi:predicted amidohydrolase YtcJ
MDITCARLVVAAVCRDRSEQLRDERQRLPFAFREQPGAGCDGQPGDKGGDDMIASHERLLVVGLVALMLASGCAPSPTAPSSASATSPSAATTPVPSAPASPSGSLVIVGRILTMDEPPIAEALLIEDGAVTAVGTRDEVLALASEQVPVVDIGRNVAYPGFIDAHAHWIGDREYYGIDSPAAAMDAALTRGWTSISEQWVNPERLDELSALAADDALPVRVDAFLALNFGNDFLGDWYVSREPGPVDDHLRVRGLKIHLDDGGGNTVLWERADLTETIARADEAGWQVSVHAISSAAMDLVLDAYEGALGPTGLNPLHHRIEHAVQVTDEQLARLVAMEIPLVIHLDGAAEWVLGEGLLAQFDRDSPGEEMGWIARWRDFVDAGLHVASASDAPWTFPDFELTDDIGRPVDQIAAGMDGRVRTSPVTPPWLLDQLLTAEQGLRAVTLDAAYALGDEARRGHLAPGTWATSRS